MAIFPIGRKAKDQRDLRAANASGGSVVIRSKNKIANPTNPSQTLSRGSKVTINNTSNLKIDKPTITPGASHTTVEKQTSNRFVPGDYQKNGPIDRSTTPELGKSLREDPAKTKMRMDAQERGQTSYVAGGKKEYSGRNESRSTYVAKTTKDPDTMKMGAAHVVSGKEVSVSNSAMAPKSTKPSRGFAGMTLHRSAGVNNQGHGQNYMSLNHVNKQGEKKTLLKFRTKTRGTR